MGYQERYAEAKKDGELRSLVPEFKEFVKKGDRVVGRLMHKSEVQSSVGEGSYMQYLFETDTGHTKCQMGSVTDNEAGALMEIGGVYAVEFEEKLKLKGGRTVNRFKVYEIAIAEPAPAPAEEPPPPEV